MNCYWQNASKEFLTSIFNYFPGRINTFEVSRVHDGNEVAAVVNYGEIFQSPAQEIIAQLEKNDFLIINLINVTMDDGTTRVLTPLLFRILNND